MLSTPTLSPKTLNEWTLEQNLVREISNLFDTPFGIFYPVRLRNLFDISAFDYTRIRKQKTKSYKLTPREEGTASGGWDAKFVIPPGFGRDSRVLYLQIKSGSHSEGNVIPKSIFNTNVKNPNPHADFTFNDNGDPKKGKLANQHEALSKLNQYLVAHGFSEKSVMYSFPRITNLDKFDDLDQPLIYYTTFLSHHEMDQESNANGVNLYDGALHHFRTCYIDEFNREISSDPFALNGGVETPHILEEIMMVKLARLWNDYHKLINNRRLKDYLTFSLANTLAVNPFELIENSSRLFYSAFQKELSPYFDEVQIARLNNEAAVFGANNQSSFSAFRVNMFKNIYAFIREIRGPININEQVPSIYTNPLNRNNTRRQENFIKDIQIDNLDITAVVF